MIQLFNWLIESGKSLLTLLPLSPFTEFINSWTPPNYIKYLNWFFPVTEALGVISVWLVAVGLFYGYSVLMRWVKLIGD